MPVTNITWINSVDFDLGVDFGLWNGKVSGSLDYFHRTRRGLLSSNYKAIIPVLLGYTLPQRNENIDGEVGGEFSIKYAGSVNNFSYSIKGNIDYARYRNGYTFDAKFGNSWDRYRHSLQHRWGGIFGAIR